MQNGDISRPSRPHLTPAPSRDYNNTTTFETFPFPWPPGQEPRQLPTQERRSSGETFALGDRPDERRLSRQRQIEDG